MSDININVYQYQAAELFGNFILTYQTIPFRSNDCSWEDAAACWTRSRKARGPTVVAAAAMPVGADDDEMDDAANADAAGRSPHAIEAASSVKKTDQERGHVMRGM